MGYILSKNSINGSYGVVLFTCDTDDDIANLPRYHTPGSMAKVITSGDVYILNTSQVWTKTTSGNSGSGSGDGSATTNVNISTKDDETTVPTQGDVNVTIKVSGCCGGDGDIEWDDLSDGQEIEIDDGGSGQGGCCGDKDQYWEDIGGDDSTPVTPDPEPEPDPEPDPEPEPEPSDAQVVKMAISFRTGSGGKSTSTNATIAELEVGKTYTVTGTGTAAYRTSSTEHVDIDTEITIEEGTNIIQLIKYASNIDLARGLTIDTTNNQAVAIYNPGYSSTVITSSFDLTFTEKVVTPNRTTMRKMSVVPTLEMNIDPSKIIEETPYYILIDDTGDK